MSSSSHEVTRLLLAWGDGDRAAFDRLVPLVYSELRRMARGYMRQQDPDHTLQTTALIHEAYLRLVDQKQARFQNREHFFGVAAKAMRHILVDHARGRQGDKRGGAAVKVPLDEAAVAAEEKAANLIALNGALDRLAEFDSRKCRVVELRYFGGLSIQETAAVLEVSPETVQRDWRFAKIWLYNAVSTDS